MNALDKLYGVPREEFSAKKKSLLKELREKKDERLAEEVAEAQKPTVLAAAINEFVRAEKAAVNGLLSASAAVGKEQSKAVKGKGGDSLRVAMDKEREALRRVLEAMTQRVPKLSDKEAELRGTLLAASRGSEEIQQKLRRGILSSKVEPAGFGAFLGVQLPEAAEGGAPSKTKKGAEAKERAAQREAELKKRREAKALEAEKKRLATQLARAESKAIQAENDAALLREKAEALKQEMDGLKSRLAKSGA